MKKLLGILVLGLLWCNTGFAECIKGDCNNGRGTFIEPDGQKYVGQWKDGVQNGYGLGFHEQLHLFTFVNCKVIKY